MHKKAIPYYRKVLLLTKTFTFSTRFLELLVTYTYVGNKKKKKIREGKENYRWTKIQRGLEIKSQYLYMIRSLTY